MTPERARRLPALLFDMDGTLLDSIGLIVESAVYAFDGREGPRPTRDEWQALIGTPLDAMLARWATDAADRLDYQTMFAAKEGAVAAPTAGLHFTRGDGSVHSNSSSIPRFRKPSPHRLRASSTISRMGTSRNESSLASRESLRSD